MTTAARPQAKRKSTTLAKAKPSKKLASNTSKLVDTVIAFSAAMGAQRAAHECPIFERPRERASNAPWEASRDLVREIARTKAQDKSELVLKAHALKIEVHDGALHCGGSESMFLVQSLVDDIMSLLKPEAEDVHMGRGKPEDAPTV